MSTLTDSPQDQAQDQELARESTRDESQALLVLTISPGLEDVVVDWLLGRPESPGFSSMPVHGHGSAHHVLSPVEQVAGHQRRIQFQIAMPMSQIDDFLDSARQEFGRADVHYWVLPLMAAGALAHRP